MAGDWLKLEVSTPDKEEVLAITARMGWDDPDLTVGKLFRLWRWFDQQTVDGNAARVTTALLDRIVGVTGFCDAVQEVGWLVVGEEGVSLPKFDRHNGATAKSRALTAKRVAKHKTGAGANGASVSSNVSAALPREEKRREEEEQNQKKNLRTPQKPKTEKETVSTADLVALGVDPQAAKDWMTTRKKKRLPLTLTALNGVRERAAKEGMTLPQAVAYLADKGWAGFYTDKPKTTPGRRSPAAENFDKTDYGQGGLL